MIKNVLFALYGVLFFMAQAQAGDLTSPKGTVILTVSGNIAHTNEANTAKFDLEMLEAIDQTTIETETPWHDGIQVFKGVSGKKFLEALGVKNSDRNLRVIALNDYAADVPIKDFFETGLILASQKNGQYMTVRDKGPLFLIYPFSDNPKLIEGTYHARSVWQIKAIHVN